MKVLPVIVAFKTPLWVRIALRSFSQWFPGKPVLVIDNNPHPGERAYDERAAEESQWLRDQDSIFLFRHHNRGPTAGFPPFSHGAALDAGIQWCRQQSIDAVVLFEPDCFIAGREWFLCMVEALEQGAWMAGAKTTPFGPIKPCPSAWMVEHIHGTFMPTPRPMNHPRYDELVDDEKMWQCIDPDLRGFWKHYWDTGFQNWFYAAAQDKATALATDQPLPPRLSAALHWKGFHHVGAGSTLNRDRLERLHGINVDPYLDDQTWLTATHS